MIVNDVRYNSLPGFFNRKAAEQSAAEVALLELSKSGEVSECISQPVVSSCSTIILPTIPGIHDPTERFSSLSFVPFLTEDSLPAQTIHRLVSLISFVFLFIYLEKVCG